MAILSGSIIVSSLSLLHLTLAYFLHISPATVTHHGMVMILSQAFHLPVSSSLAAPSAATSLIAALLALLGLSDLFAAGLPEEIGIFHWATQAPLRAGFFFCLTAWAWLGGPRGLSALMGGTKAAMASRTGLGGMSDGVVFSWAFLESMMWFWIFITMRDERKEILARHAAMREREAERLQL